MSGEGRCGLVLTPRPPEEPVTWTDGMDAPVGTGLAFIFWDIRIAGEGRGFDLDGRCRSAGDCVDNVIHPLGPLGNDQIRQGLLGGETLILIEIAGLDVGVGEDDDEITVKLYGAKDADDPFFPANNFNTPAGERDCCQYLAGAPSLDGNQQPHVRIPARISRGRITTRTPVSAGLAISAGRRDPRVDGLTAIERVQLSARIEETTDPDGSEPGPFLVLEDVLLGFALPSRGLAEYPNPYCKTLNQLCPRQLPDATMLDLMLTFWQPDVDLDVQPGLEQLELGWSGQLERCLDESGSVVPEVERGRPGSCVFDPTMRDGYSAAILARARQATVVGIADD